MSTLTTVEICAGGGGQALGLCHAGFDHVALAEIEPEACTTLAINQPEWKVIEGDIRNLDGRQFDGVDLLAGGVPCQPFTISGQQQGQHDERDMFPQAIRLAREARPRAILLENVPGLAARKFDAYRQWIRTELQNLGYIVMWRIINASEHGVPQLRPRFVVVAIRGWNAAAFRWPGIRQEAPPTVGEALADLMGERGWDGAAAWAAAADWIAPTLVGGSRKHGGPDLGPTRARQAWASLGVDGRSLADEAPGPEGPGDRMPRLTLRMAARIQGFPDTWKFAGGKTAAYRQIGNAFPPPVACRVGGAIREILEAA